MSANAGSPVAAVRRLRIGLLVRLKGRLLVNTLSRGLQQAFGMLAAAILGLLGAALAFGALSVGVDPESWAERVVLILAGAWIGWILLPVLTFSSDDTLDPRRFALLPIRPRALVPGLLASAFIGIGPIATTLGVSGVVVGAARFGGSSGAGALAAAAFALVAAVLFLLTCVTTSRAVTTAASNLLTSRRGRDLAVFLAVLLGIAAFFAFQTLNQFLILAAESQYRFDITPLIAVARWLPGGLAGAAIVDAASGRYGPGVLRLAGLAAWTVAALLVWGWAMDRIAVRQPTTSTSGRSAERISLYPRGLRWLPRTRLTAVAMRFLRGLGRDVRVRTQALQQAFILFPMVVISVTGGAVSEPTAPLLASMFAVPVGIIAVNQLGLDGPALWQHELAGAEPRTDLYGRNLALAIVGLPLCAVVTVVLAAFSGGWVYVPIAIVLSAATLAVLLGCANLGAVLLPIPVPEASTNIFGSSRSGQGCINGLLSAIVLLVMGVLVLPILLSMLLLDSPGARAIAAGAALVFGLLILIGGTRFAAAFAEPRGPELLAAVDPGRGAPR